MVEPSTDLAVIASRYQTVHTPFTFDGSTVQRLVAADPRRWFIRFTLLGAPSGTYPILPGPPITLPALLGVSISAQEHKYRDCPSIVTGEWYAGAAALDRLIITECIYLGE